jgi:hypothetical protein
MLFIFSTPVIIRLLWQLKTVVFLHWRLICAILLDPDCPDGVKFCHLGYFLKTQAFFKGKIVAQKGGDLFLFGYFCQKQMFYIFTIIISFLAWFVEAILRVIK